MPALAAYTALLAVFAWTIRRGLCDDARARVAVGGAILAYVVFSLVWFDTFETQFVLIGVMAFAEGIPTTKTCAPSTASSWTGSPGPALRTGECPPVRSRRLAATGSVRAGRHELPHRPASKGIQAVRARSESG